MISRKQGKGNAMLKLHVLASGSRGNAAVVVNDRTGEGVLVDCGICKRAFFEAAEAVGFDVAGLRAVVVTHDHGDHVKGLGVVLRGLAKAGVRPAVYASEAVLAASAPLRDAVASVGACCQVFEAGDRLELAGMTLRPFPTSHDAAASFGFRFEEAASSDEAPSQALGGDVLGYVTDTGIVTEEAWEALAGVRLLALESNHDARMLATGPYPYPVKQRIASNRGHLSNEQAAEALARLVHEGLEQVVAMHVSQENNTYRLPRETLAAALDAAAPELSGQVRVSVAFQDRPITIA